MHQLLTIGMAGWRPEEVVSLQTRAGLEKDEQTQNPHLPHSLHQAGNRKQRCPESSLTNTNGMNPNAFSALATPHPTPLSEESKDHRHPEESSPQVASPKAEGVLWLSGRERLRAGQELRVGGDSPGLNTPVHNHCPTLCVSHSAGFHSTLDNEKTE